MVFTIVHQIAIKTKTSTLEIPGGPMIVIGNALKSHGIASNAFLAAVLVWHYEDRN